MILGLKSPGGVSNFQDSGGSILRGIDFSRGFRFSEKNSPAAGSYLVIFIIIISDFSKKFACGGPLSNFYIKS